ncbi:MAG TPA: DegT/DnrJ/EryC1/StrS family aminotransferase [Phycisphaerae bacterium]|nr:DegT/DnrJ/EryC1/StrS family aminotransferase [Phycisphaerae bacterium]
MAKLAILGGQAVRSEPWPAWPQYGPEVQEAILRVARSNCYHPQFGHECEAFEQAFAAYHGAKHAVAVANGTLALQVAMAAAGVGCGDEVIVPAYTYVASASAAVDQNAIPMFVDSEPRSQGLDPDDVRRKITARTKAIVAVHCNGYPCDMDAVMQIAREHDLVVIEDCSHAHGAEYKGRKVGTIGHLGAFSLQQKKNLSAGVGGVVITNDTAMAERMRQWRTFSWSHVGHNWLISEFHAAIAGALLPQLDDMNEVRRANASTLLGALGTVEGITPLPGLPETKPVFYNLILQYDQTKIGASRKAFVAALKAEGIPIHMFYVPLQHWPIFAEQDFFGQGCPFSCPKYAGGPVDYSKVSTPVADAVCDSVNLEIKVQPTSGAIEMKQTAEAIRKLVANKAELKDVDQAIVEGKIK